MLESSQPVAEDVEVRDPAAMVNTECAQAPDGAEPTLKQRLEHQRAAFSACPFPSAETRLTQLSGLQRLLVDNQQALAQALSADFGHRAKDDSMFGDILPSVQMVKYQIRHLKRWMKPQRRRAGLLLAPAQVKVVYQPLGVVGIVVPWNFPLMLSIGPLASALAAGNRAMIKMSEFTPHTNALLKRLLAQQFCEDEVAIVEGEADVAQAFSALPFDHLLFTGSTAVGHHVMRAAAENLTPVTLELGGKSPVIIAPDMAIDTAVARMIYGKTVNAGQICVSPDYVLCPADKLSEFCEQFVRRFQQMYPNGEGGDDYSCVINSRQYQRLQAWLADAEEKGAQVIPCGGRGDDNQRRMATQLLLNVSDEMTLMQQEIFGPLLPIIPYTDIDEALEYIAKRPRPLALYLLSFDKALQQRIETETHSGGVCINDTIFHVAADDAPFGGIGPSGMGHYHGHEGFLTFSKAKTVLKQGLFASSLLVHPPYGRWLQKLLVKIFVR
ncbi:coniferyl aldehyde dehydrogenase [Corallincola spongiicola]|uniref:Aldehyde dehydrogenase n=1 Tax=Corallincola spongiicola TaxID=2520508 RepID=A0ABY1WQ25_9GAMM|nr:coniferyl aldehyde dehydrogenase [Corallincola spongiicola]TAA46845.1 coniferyl aldehyde dehydrogenase [Corallincola spongiicola]